MATVSFYGSHLSAQVDISISQSISTNKSTLRVNSLKLRNEWGEIGTAWATGTININGSQALKMILNNTQGCTFVFVKDEWCTVNLGSGATLTSITVSHNNDGSHSPVSVSVSISAQNARGTYDYGSIIGSSSVSLSTIPREPSITNADNFTDEGNPTITYSNIAGNSVISLQAGIFDNAGSVAYAGYRDISKTGTSYTFNLTNAERTALRNAIPNSKSMTVKFYIKSILDGVTYYKSIAKTFSIVNGSPTLNPTVQDTNSTTLALTGDANRIVKYFSNAKITIGATAIKGASLSSQKVTCGNKSLTTASGTLNAIESGTFVFTATDSRSNSTSKTINKTFIDYIKLTCNFKPSVNISGKITFTINGNYFSGSFGKVANTLALSYRYKVEGGSYNSWISVTPSASGGTYSGNVNFTIPNFDYRKTYSFQVKAQDKLITIESAEYPVKALPVFDWSSSDFNFNVPVTISNTTVSKTNHVVTKGYVDTAIANISILNLVYPIGSIYMSVNSTNPQNLFGGTWVQLKDRFLLGAGNTYAAETTGGEAAHILNTNEIPSHSHSFKGGSHTWIWGQTVTNNVYLTDALASAGSTPSNNAMTSQGYWSETNATGGNGAHNNMPPYLVVYMWKRTA